MKCSAPQRLVHAEKRALEALDGRLCAVDFIRTRAHGSEPPNELDASVARIILGGGTASAAAAAAVGGTGGGSGAAEGEHERFFARDDAFGCILGLRGCCGCSCDHVQRELAARVARLLERFADGRYGHAFAPVFAPFGEQPLVALRVVKQAHLQRGAGRCEEDGAAADEEVGGWELLGGEFRQRHLFFCSALFPLLSYGAGLCGV